MAVPVYPSDLNDAEWALLAPLIPSSKPHGRPRSSDMRRITRGPLLSNGERPILHLLWAPQLAEALECARIRASRQRHFSA
jgi:hypothetical protein